MIELNQVKFRWPGSSTSVIDIERFSIEKGDKVFLKGPSGTGKSTLLGLIAGVSLPDSGDVKVLGQNINHIKGRQRDHFRADHMGYIFQMFNLLPYLSVTENVCLPCHFSKRRKNKALTHSPSLNAEAHRLLSDLQLGNDLINRPVAELSIGQQQRVAAARALIGQPELVIADEPSSALDTDARESFINLLFQECNREKSTLLFVSHDDTLSPLFDQQIELSKINLSSKRL
ncbi:ABC transporter ATP-binding protein [Alkalimarinus alittae]|uniref:ABC transporter ATP-binding protein n=1 Tax=Alkalimarinus alittae TaxID=2961619 RepID=A0ABY6N7G5_9ALTE|nr:ABC transporter ATP-binding protein [Alkalimarinus alittae]UZE98063.1 ABC transporter ATP-binding protein [Alkalimarinus alittae]